jgi:hypothetical protein
VDESDLETNSYDLIIDRDLIHEIGIDICFSASEVRWDNASIPMQSVDKSTEEFEQELLFTQDPSTTDVERIQNIVESKCYPADLNKIVAGCNLPINYYNDNIEVPKQLQKHVIDWYHITLCHPGINRTEANITQYLFWPKMRD